MYYERKEQGQGKALSGVRPELSFLEKDEFSKLQDSGKDMLRLWNGMRGREIGHMCDISKRINWYRVEELLKPEFKNPP